jgi:hypothetical protein
MNHPSSAGLRKLADFLDGCASDLEVPVRATLTLSKENIGPLLKLLRILPPPMKDTSDEWESILIDASHKFDGLSVELWNWRREVCEQVEEMRPVKVWRCGGVEVKAEGAA